MAVALPRSGLVHHNYDEWDDKYDADHHKYDERDDKYDPDHHNHEDWDENQ